MASLKEIKNRIASIKSTQKITAAMKMVSSAKLHHTQAATERTLAYSMQLSGILHSLLSAEAEMDSPYTVSRDVKNVAIVVCLSLSDWQTTFRMLRRPSWLPGYRNCSWQAR